MPRKFSPTGAYSETALDRVRAYQILVHAEIEAFVEDVAREAIISAFRIWDAEGRIAKPLLALVACFAAKTDLPAAVSQSGSKGHVKEQANKAAQSMHAAIQQNNGIKAANVMRLLLPIGVEEAVLDPLWLTDMDAFGAMRGDVAHQSSASTLVKYAIDPQTEAQRVTRLLQGLKQIDSVIRELSR